MTVLRPAPPRRRQYPHVEGIGDWRAQQSLRLLWDRLFDLDGQLQALLRVEEDLSLRIDALDDRLDQVQVMAGEALTLAQRTPGESAPTPGGGPSTMPNYFSIVSGVLAGFDPVVPEAEAAAGAAQLTRVSAWEIYQVDPNIRLLAKSGGTQINGRSIDVIVQATDGSYTDMASWHDNEDGTVTILAMWQPNGPSGDRDLSREIVPTAAIAAEAGPMAPA